MKNKLVKPLIAVYIGAIKASLRYNKISRKYKKTHKYICQNGIYILRVFFHERLIQS